MLESFSSSSLSVGAFLFVVHLSIVTISRKMKEATKKIIAAATKRIRVASVLPSATEILCSIGGDYLLVGRSHEDNFPSSITHLPMLTDQLISREWTSAAAVNAEVSSALSSGKSLYFLNAELLTELKPDLILTQDLCSVCAIDLAEVRLIASKMNPQPAVLSLDPQTLEDVLADMIIVGEAVGLQKEAAKAKAVFEDRVRAVIAVADEILGAKSKEKERVKVAFIEWSDPIYVGGHWTPQLIYMAGGEHTLNPCGEGAPNSYVQIGGAGKSFPVTIESVIASDPDLVIIAPCGLNLEMSRREADRLMCQQWFQDLRAIKNKRLLVVDGDAMFNRPGPRLVDALEWLVSVFHEKSSNNAKSVARAVSLRPKDFPFFDYFEVVSTIDSETTLKDVKKKEEELILMNIEEAHLAACSMGSNTYTDPVTGYQVFTEFGHKKRGKCCGNRCRHCPFGHYNVKEENRNPSSILKILKPTLLRSVGKKRVKRGTMQLPLVTAAATAKQATATDSVVSIDVLFWSGGKDSYLSLLILEQLYLNSKSDRRLVLLTTFEGSSPFGAITHQGMLIRDVMDQAKALGLDLLLVPLPDKNGQGVSNVSYKETILHALDELKSELISDSLRDKTSSDIKMRLCFGDLHLKDIRDWRESCFGGQGGYDCFFPAFGADYQQLQNVLWKATESEVKSITISAWTGLFNDESTAEMAAKGTTYDQAFVAALPSTIDQMGENGEFHTHVTFRKEAKVCEL